MRCRTCDLGYYRILIYVSECLSCLWLCRNSSSIGVSYAHRESNRVRDTERERERKKRESKIKKKHTHTHMPNHLRKHTEPLSYSPMFIDNSNKQQMEFLHAFCRLLVASVIAPWFQWIVWGMSQFACAWNDIQVKHWISKFVTPIGLEIERNGNGTVHRFFHASNGTMIRRFPLKSNVMLDDSAARALNIRHTSFAISLLYNAVMAAQWKLMPNFVILIHHFSLPLFPATVAACRNNTDIH